MSVTHVLITLLGTVMWQLSYQSPYYAQDPVWVLLALRLVLGLTGQGTAPADTKILCVVLLVPEI